MKKMMTMMAVVLCMAQSAMALTMLPSDRLSTSKQGNTTIVSLNGGAGSATSELFSILDKAGVKATQYIEGKNLQGNLLTAYVAFLNGARYGASLTVDPTDSQYGITAPRCAPASKCLGIGTNLILTGAVAEELYGYMEKADLPVSHLVGASTIQGSNVTCSKAITYPKLSFSCSIRLKSAN